MKCVDRIYFICQNGRLLCALYVFGRMLWKWTWCVEWTNFATIPIGKCMFVVCNAISDSSIKTNWVSVWTRKLYKPQQAMMLLINSECDSQSHISNAWCVAAPRRMNKKKIPKWLLDIVNIVLVICYWKPWILLLIERK